MKAVVVRWIVIICIVILFISPSAQAQDGDDEATDETCILSTFCVIILFILFLIYISSRRRNQDSKYPSGPRNPQYPPQQPGYSYPMPHTYPPPSLRGQGPPTPKTDIKCDLCDSKNLRAFEDGYYKCNDCRHVFYHTEISRRKR